MDNRRLWLLFILAIPLVLYWTSIMTWVGRQLGYDMTPPKPQVVATQPTTRPGIAAAATQPGLAGVEATTQPAGGAVVTPNLTVLSQPDGRPAGDIGSVKPNDAQYVMGVTFNKRGAGIDAVTLNQFTAHVDSDARYVFQQPYPTFADASRPLASQLLKLTVEGEPTRTIDLSLHDWASGERTTGSAEFFVDLADTTGRPLIRVLKKYRLATLDESRGKAGGYELFVELRFENRSGKPVSVSQAFNGPVMPPRELDRGSDRNIVGGYLYEGAIKIRHDYIESFGGSTVAIDYTAGKNKEPVLWAGTCSVYFNAILRLDPIATAAGTPLTPEYVGKIEGRVLDAENPNSHERHVVTRFETTAVSLAVGESKSLPMRLFVGPRQRSLLNNEYLSALPLAYDQTLVLTSGPCGFCTFQWLVNILVWMLGVFHFIVRDWGVAIILLVLLVRTLLHPITKKSQVNMMAMSKFGPELERIKTKYKDNPQEQQRAMMQFYKQHGATPVLGCLPMLLQMPIWIALFSALQSTFELRQAPFLEFGGINLTWIKDLAQPDHLIKFDQTYTFFFIVVSGLNILPFLLAVVFFLQHKFTPKPPAMTPEQEQQQKIMQWMTLLFPLMLYGGPSGLNLYILASTTFGIIESKIIRDHIKQREAAEKAGAVVLDASDTPRGKRNPSPGNEAAKPQGWLARKMAEMQKRLDDIQKQAEQQKKKRS